jgi:mRNA interferase HicA
MKRKNLEKFLALHGCYLVREGRSHSIFGNQNNRNKSPVPRHNEVDNYLVKKICRDLGIPVPKKYN